MKRMYLILLVLSTGTLELEEACKTSSSSAFALLRGGKKKFDYDLIIIGAGAQGVAAVIQLSVSKIKPPYRILIVEIKPALGVGLPYDPKVVKSEHLMNVFSPSVVAISGGSNEFLRWLADNSEDEKITSDFTQKATPKRITIGKYLSDRFTEYVEKRKKKRYTFETMNNTEAVNIEAHKTGHGYLVKLSTKPVPVHVRDVFLATGHWYRGRFKHPPKGYYESPWPADLILAGIKPMHIGIGGGGLSGIDMVLTAAHEFGKFNHDNSDYETEHENFNITMYSRSGYLPGVRRDDDARLLMYEPRQLTPKNVGSAIRKNNLTAFDALFKYLKLDLAEVLPSLNSVQNIEKMEPAEFFQLVDQDLYTDTDPEENFFKDMDGKGSRHRYRLRVLFMMAETFIQALREVCAAEDVIKFKEHIAPRVEKVAIQIPDVNAQKLRTLMKKGRLHLKAIGQNYKIDKKTGGQGVTLKYWHRQPDGTEDVEIEVHHDYFIDALGQSGHIAKDPSKLIESLLKNNLATPIRFLYKNQEYAKIVYEGDESEDKNRNRIVKIDGKYYLDGDGVVMDMDEARVIPGGGVSNTGNIYASGPFILGDTVRVSYGIPTAVTTAKKAVKNIEKVRK